MKITKAILISIFMIVLLVAIVHYTKLFIVKNAIVSFKKLYNTYSQALDMTVIELDGETDCYFSTNSEVSNEFSGCEKFYKEFATNLKVTKYCKDNSLKNGCLPVYNSYAINPSCAGFSESMMNRYNQTFVMRDKTTLTVFNQPSGAPKPIFALDSNGKIFPNRSGYDLFSLVVIRNQHGHYTFHPNVTYCLPQETGGIQKLQDVYK